MKIPWRLVALGVVAFLLFLVATVPAEFVLSRMSKQGISAAGVTGSLWNGRAAVLQIGSAQLGTVTWNIRMLSLFTGKLSADVAIKREDGSAKATVAVGLGKTFRVRDLQGTLPIAALGGLGLPGGGWQGEARFRFSQIDLQNNWPVSAVGSMDALNLVGPANQPTALGNFRVEFAEPAAKREGLTGNLISMGEGPVDLKGTLNLAPNRVYTLDALVVTHASAPPAIIKALQYLAPPDNEGRRRLSFSGSL